jgi:hypothetical protein
MLCRETHMVTPVTAAAMGEHRKSAVEPTLSDSRSRARGAFANE